MKKHSNTKLFPIPLLTSKTVQVICLSMFICLTVWRDNGLVFIGCILLDNVKGQKVYWEYLWLTRIWMKVQKAYWVTSFCTFIIHIFTIKFFNIFILCLIYCDHKTITSWERWRLCYITHLLPGNGQILCIILTIELEANTTHRIYST